MCRLGGCRLQPHLLAGPIHHQQGSDLADAGLHRLEADQLPIELVEQLLHPSTLIGRLQIHLAVSRANWQLATGLDQWIPGRIRGGHRWRRQGALSIPDHRALSLARRVRFT
jgi:hypothetical protein